MTIRLVNLLLFILAAYVLQSCDPKCEEGDFYMELTFIDSTGVQLSPIWDRVYGLGAEKDLIMNDSISEIPVNSSQDSTVYFFERGGETERLAFAYSRTIFHGKRNRGYCLTLLGEDLLPSTTFDVRSLIFESGTSLGGRSQIYEIQIDL